MDSVAFTDRLLASTERFVPAGPEGVPTPLPRLKVWSSDAPTSPMPGLFSPMFYVVLRGTRILTLGDNRFELPAGSCVASSFGLPYVSEFAQASPEAPYVALSLDLDTDLLSGVMLDMPHVAQRWSCAAAEGSLSGPVAEVFTRLIDLLSMPDDIKVLAPAYERELYYRLLQSPMGDTLRQIGQSNERLARIKQAADRLAADPAAALAIPDLAAAAGMSVTTFHRQFKAMTGHSPIAFQRQLRLLEARKLLTGGQANVSGVAHRVGYVSASQFSREYKSLFGRAPVWDLL